MIILYYRVGTIFHAMLILYYIVGTIFHGIGIYCITELEQYFTL